MKNTKSQRRGSPRRVDVFPQILIMTLSLLLFGGGGGSYSIADGLDGVVSESDRERRAVEVGQRIDKACEEARERVFGFRRRLFNLTTNYDSTREQVDALFREFNASWSNEHERLVSLRFDLRSELWSDEWGRLFENLREQRSP